MATVFQPQDEEKDKQAEQPNQPMNAAPTSSAAPNAAPSAPAPQRQGSGRFVNIQKYIQANQGNNQLGQQIGSKIGGEAQNIQKGIQSSQQQFQQAVNPEQQRLSNANQTIQSAVQTANTNPASLSQDQLAQFQAFREGQANGPTGLSNEDQLRQQQQNLASTAGMTGSEAGRFQLLQQYFGKPTYTRGQQRLDQLLLQSAPNSLRNLQQSAQGAVSGVGQTLSGAQQSTQDILNQLGQQRAAAQQQAQEQVGTAQTGLQGDITGEAAKQTQARQDIYNKLQQLAPNLYNKAVVNKPTLSEDELRMAGLDPSMQMYKLDLNSLLKAQGETPGMQVSKEQAVTPEQMARLNALSQLSGQNQSFISGPQQAQEFRPFDLEALKGQSASDVASRQSDAGHQAARGTFSRTNIANIPEQIKWDIDRMKALNLARSPGMNFMDQQQYVREHGKRPTAGMINGTINPNTGLPVPKDQYGLGGMTTGDAANLILHPTYNHDDRTDVQKQGLDFDPYSGAMESVVNRLLGGGGGMEAKHMDFAGDIKRLANQYNNWYSGHPLSTLGQLTGTTPNTAKVGAVVPAVDSKTPNILAPGTPRPSPITTKGSAQINPLTGEEVTPLTPEQLRMLGK